MSTIITREEWNALLGGCSPETAEYLKANLAAWEGGDTSKLVEVRLDSMGRLDSESSPIPCIKLKNVPPALKMDRRELRTLTFGHGVRPNLEIAPIIRSIVEKGWQRPRIRQDAIVCYRDGRVGRGNRRVAALQAILGVDSDFLVDVIIVDAIRHGKNQ